MKLHEGRRCPRRAAFTLVELMVASSILVVVLAAAFGLLHFTRTSSDGNLGPQVGLQFTTRTALVQFIHEIQECIEISRPYQGSSLNYFIARDKLNRILMVYSVRNAGASAQAGRQLLDLVLYRYDFGVTAPEASRRVIVPGVERVTFTALSPGLLEIHLTAWEKGKSFTLLTAVRTRNIVQEGNL